MADKEVWEIIEDSTKERFLTYLEWLNEGVLENGPNNGVIASNLVLAEKLKWLVRSIDDLDHSVSGLG